MALALLLSTATVIATSTLTAHEDAWHVVEGYNAVMGEVCSADPSCRWVRAAGRAASAELCQAMCAEMASNTSEPEACTVFAWSGSTHSCWLRTDGLWGAPGTLVPEPKRISGCLHGKASIPNATMPPGCGTNPLARRPALGAVASAPSATPIELDAAQQLAFYLGNLGGWLPGAAGSTPAPVAVAVGYDASIAAGVSPAELANLGGDGFLITTNSSSVLAVTGGRHSPRGCLFGVYDLLRRLGCEFLSSDMLLAEELPGTPLTALPSSLHARIVPPIELRDSNEFGQTHHPRWAAKVGMNGPFASGPAYKGGPPLFPPAGMFAHAWTSDSFWLLGPTPYPSADLWAHHREWFWPRKDSNNRTTCNSTSCPAEQLCWHNASLVRFVTASVKTLLLSNPNATIVMVAQEDNLHYCNDSAAQRVIQEEGSPGGPLFRAVNAIAEAIEDEFPHAMVQTLAYEWSRFPPRTRPRKNVIIELCDIEANFGASLSDPSNAGFQRTIAGWQALTSGPGSGSLHIWNYVSSFSMPHVGCDAAFHDPVSCGMFIQPFPNYYVLGSNIKFFHRMGVTGLFEEGDDSSAGGDMNALKNFVMARMMWDPSLNPSTLIDSFLRGYYYSAAPHVREYMDIMHHAVQETKFYMNAGIPSNAPIYTPANLLGCARAMAAAVTAARSEPRRVQMRVDAAKVSTYYIVLVHWQAVTAFAGSDWPLENTKEAAWQEFTRVWNATRMTFGSAFHCDLGCVRAQLFGPHSGRHRQKSDEVATISVDPNRKIARVPSIYIG